MTYSSTIVPSSGLACTTIVNDKKKRRLQLQQEQLENQNEIGEHLRRFKRLRPRDCHPHETGRCSLRYKQMKTQQTINELCSICQAEFECIQQRREHQQQILAMNNNIGAGTKSTKNVSPLSTKDAGSVNSSEIENENRSGQYLPTLQVQVCSEQQEVYRSTSHDGTDTKPSSIDLGSRETSKITAIAQTGTTEPDNVGSSSLLLVSRQHQQLRHSPKPHQHPPPLTLRRPLSDRENFLLFIKILLKLLANESGLDSMLRRAKMVVSDCTQRNRNNDPECVHLSEAIERYLRPIIIDRVWTKAKDMLHFYMTNQQQQRDRQQQRRQLQQEADTATSLESDPSTFPI